MNKWSERWKNENHPIRRAKSSEKQNESTLKDLSQLLFWELWTFPLSWQWTVPHGQRTMHMWAPTMQLCAYPYVCIHVAVHTRVYECVIVHVCTCVHIHEYEWVCERCLAVSMCVWYPCGCAWVKWVLWLCYLWVVSTCVLLYMCMFLRICGSSTPD